MKSPQLHVLQQRIREFSSNRPFQILRAERKSGIKLEAAIADGTAGINRPEERTGEEVAAYESEMEQFEIMTSSELIALVRRAPALRNSFGVARATNWFRKKANTLRKLEPRASEIKNVFHSTPYRRTGTLSYVKRGLKLTT